MEAKGRHNDGNDWWPYHSSYDNTGSNDGSQYNEWNDHGWYNRWQSHDNAGSNDGSQYSNDGSWCNGWNNTSRNDSSHSRSCNNTNSNDGS